MGKNTSFEGKMGFEGMARLDGKFDGGFSPGMSSSSVRRRPSMHRSTLQPSPSMGR